MPLRWVVMLGMTCTRSEQSQRCERCEWCSSGWSLSKTSVGLFNPLILFPGLHIFLTWDLCVHCTSSAIYSTQRQLQKMYCTHIPNTTRQQTHFKDKKQQTAANLPGATSFQTRHPQKTDAPPKSVQESVEWCDLSSSESLLRGWHKGPTLSQVGLELGIPPVLVLESGGRWCLRHFLGMEDQPHSGWYVRLRLSSEDSEEIEHMSVDLEYVPFLSRLLGKYHIKLEICIIIYNENVEVYIES